MDDNMKYNAALLKMEQFLLEQHPDIVTPGVLDNMLVHCGRAEEAMAHLLCAAMGLHLENPDNQQFFQQWLLPSLHCLSAENCGQVPYMTLLAGAGPAAVGSVELSQEECPACRLFPCGDLQLSPQGVLHAPMGFCRSAFRYPSLKQHGREWMTLSPNEIITMEEPLRDLHGHVLVYGLGIGYYAYQALCTPAVQQVTVVENDADVIALFKKYILPLWPGQSPEEMPFGSSYHFSIVRDDAFRHAESTGFACEDGLRADVVFTDIWHDAADGQPLYQRMRALEHCGDGYVEFRYWIEPTLKYYLGEV